MKKKSKFGLEEIDSKEKSQKIQEVFSSVASNYDLMNDLMSLGSHRAVSYTHLTLPTNLSV